jgi:hypothetical protein
MEAHRLEECVQTVASRAQSRAVERRGDLNYDIKEKWKNSTTSRGFSGFHDVGRVPSTKKRGPFELRIFWLTKGIN